MADDSSTAQLKELKVRLGEVVDYAEAEWGGWNVFAELHFR